MSVVCHDNKKGEVMARKRDVVERLNVDKVVTLEQESLVKMLSCGIEKFYKRDAEQLFGHGKKKKNIDERAMVGCIYRYMYESFHNACERFPHIDIEYNRMLNLKKDEVEKSLISCKCCKCVEKVKGGMSCATYANELKKRLSGHDSVKDTIGVRPDIIVHKRNHPDNGLVVEFKKLNGDVSYDKLKVRYATCSYSPLHYVVGAIVRLRHSNAHVEIYKLGQRVGKFVIPKK